MNLKLAKAQLCNQRQIEIVVKIMNLTSGIFVCVFFSVLFPLSQLFFTDFYHFVQIPLATLYVSLRVDDILASILAAKVKILNMATWLLFGLKKVSNLSITWMF